MRNILLRPVAPALLALLILAACTQTDSLHQGVTPQDGTETLGPPSIAIAAGTGIIAGGTGMVVQPATLDIDVPGSVQQVLLYWEGQMSNDTPGDDTIVVDGIEVTGTLIGGPTLFSGERRSSGYRADITALGLIGPGANSLTLGGLEFTHVDNGAGVLVIFDDGSDPADISVRDGLDIAFIFSPAPRDSTVPQTIDFPAAPVDRTARLSMFFSSVEGAVSSGDQRPTTIEITVGGSTTTLFNQLSSNSGDEWDTLNLDISIPAGADSLTVEAFSADGLGTGLLPASFTWLAAGLSVRPPEISQSGRFTGGINIVVDEVRYTGGLTLHCDNLLSNNLNLTWDDPANGTHHWHIEKESLDFVFCSDDPAIIQHPPRAPIDTFAAQATGSLNGEDGSVINFVFVDGGEPGRKDSVDIQIFAPGGGLVLDISGTMDKGGNLQAHYDQPHDKKP